MYVSGPRGKMILNIPGEVFDMSHAFEMDRKKDKYLGDIKHNPLFETHKIYAYNLKLLGYSELGFYKDTSKIIFYDVDHVPWLDVKYKKRIIRIVSIAVLSLFGTDQEKSNIPYLQKLRYLGDVINAVEKDFKNWSKLPFTELGILQFELYNTFNFLLNRLTIFFLPESSSEHLLKSSARNNSLINADTPSSYQRF